MTRDSFSCTSDRESTCKRLFQCVSASSNLFPTTIARRLHPILPSGTPCRKVEVHLGPKSFGSWSTQLALRLARHPSNGTCSRIRPSWVKESRDQWIPSNHRGEDRSLWLASPGEWRHLSAHPFWRCGALVDRSPVGSPCLPFYSVWGYELLFEMCWFAPL